VSRAATTGSPPWRVGLQAGAEELRAAITRSEERAAANSAEREAKAASWRASLLDASPAAAEAHRREVAELEHEAEQLGAAVQQLRSRLEEAERQERAADAQQLAKDTRDRVRALIRGAREIDRRQRELAELLTTHAAEAHRYHHDAQRLNTLDRALGDSLCDGVDIPPGALFAEPLELIRLRSIDGDVYFWPR
jgi:hypothetical protein